MWWTPWVWSLRTLPPSAVDELRLVLAARRGCPRARARPRSGQRARSGASRGWPRRGLVRRWRPPRPSSTTTGSGGSCFTPSAVGLTRMLPLTAGAKAPTTSRTADGKTLTPRTISMSSVRPMQRIRGPVRPQAHGLIRTSTWSRVRKRSSGAARWRRWVSTSSPVAPSASSSAAPVSGSISSGWTKPRAPRCIPSWSSHSPQSETPMSPIPIASVTFAPQPSSSLRAERRLAAAGLARDEDALHARAAQVDSPFGRPLERGRRHTTGVSTAASGSEQLDRGDQPLGVAGADRDVAEPDPLERAEAPRPRRTGRRCRSRRSARRRRPRGRVAAGGAGRPSCRGRRR